MARVKREETVYITKQEKEHMDETVSILQQIYFSSMSGGEVETRIAKLNMELREIMEIFVLDEEGGPAC